MATTPSNYGRFIGRVGGLAVALGIGVALASDPAVAAADDTQSSSSEASSEDSSTSTPAGADTGSSRTSTSPSQSPSTSVGARDTDDDESDDRGSARRTSSRDDDTTPSRSSDDAPEDDSSAMRDSGPDTTVDAQTTVARFGGDDDDGDDGDDRSGGETVATAAPPAPDTPAAPSAPTAALMTMAASATREVEATQAAETVSPLATPEQLAAERIATQTVNTLPVFLMKLILRQQFLSAANGLYPGGADAQNLAALDKAVNEYAMAAAFQQQLLDSMNPKFVTQVAPPHIWFGQNVGGSRILYDNPDTIYRFMGVNGASAYEIRGRFQNWDDPAARPADITFSVLEGLAGTTSTILTVDDDFEVNDDGSFVITVSRAPANGRRNHLQLTAGSTIIAARDTLGDWNTEDPMSLSVQRVGGPPDSLFAQLGGFAFLGQFVSSNPLLTTLVSLVPPLPGLPPFVRGLFTAAILVVRGGGEQSKYMALATTDPRTGSAREVNTVSQPASNAEFLANQLQSLGHFQLENEQALVLTIDPGSAGYFIVPAYDIWTITGDVANAPISLNNEQAIANGDGTYTVVISPDDPLARNWVSTGGLNQGTIAIRFQDLDPASQDLPRILDQRVLTHEELRDFLPQNDFVTAQQRADQLALRKAGFNRRWAPFPQP